MTILVIAEHNNKELKSSTKNVVEAAKKIGGDIEVLVAGKGTASVSGAVAKLDNIKKVLEADDVAYENFIAENIAELVLSIANNYTHILAPATTFGKDFMPRVAALLDVAQVSDIISVESADTFKRPIYAGNAIATVKSTDKTKVITVRTSSFGKAGDSGSATIEKIASKGDKNLASFVSKEETKSARPDLTTARVVISGGRGFGSGDKFKMIESLADKLGAAIGASRAAVDAGYVPNDYQVGQTGKIVAPELYIAIGISGAIQHLAGMKESKVIVVINKDENAPIFEIADYGLVADLFQALPEFEKAITK